MSYLWIPCEAAWRVCLPGLLSAAHALFLQRLHANPNMQLVLASGDSVHFQRGDRKLILHHGGFLLLQPNEVHNGWGEPEPTSRFYFAQFLTTPMASWRSLAPIMPPSSAGATEFGHLVIPDLGRLVDPEPVLMLFAELVECWRQRRPYYHIQAATLLQRIFLHIALSAFPLDQEHTERGAHTPRQLTILQQVVEYVENHWAEPFDGQALCVQLNLSYKYVSRIVRYGLGMNLVDYVRRKKIAEAKALLLSGAYTVAQVAQAVGFQDPYYFSRVFSRYEGVSPRGFVQRAYGRMR